MMDELSPTPIFVEEADNSSLPEISNDHMVMRNFCSALGDMLIGRFAKMSTEHVSDEMVLCTRLDTHDNIPVTVTKAKIPFLTVALYKRYLNDFHQ